MTGSPAFAAVLLFVLLLASCSGRIGWGVVLWTVQGTPAKAGTVVPLYLKSNITKVYVIGVENSGTGAGEERIEVPLWQIQAFKSKKDALGRADKFGALRSTYLIAARDGLPVRESPSNTADRVYRMRDGEMVKALEMVEGEELFTGGTKLQGNWYKVLAGDGTVGYAFSYAMELFDETVGSLPGREKLAQGSEATDALFSNAWRPAWYATMLSEGSVDLDYFSLKFGLFGDAINRQLRMELPGFSRVFQYSSITEESGWLVFGSTDLRIKIEDKGSLLAAWNGTIPDREPEETAGWNADPGFARFVVPGADVREAIRAEESRRSQAARDFFALAGGTIPLVAGALEAVSEESGALTLFPGGSFSWTGGASMPAGFAPESSDASQQGAARGAAVYGLRLAGELARQWQGGFSLYPEDSGARLDYLYRFDAAGLTLARAALSPPGEASATQERRFGTHTFIAGAAR